MMNRYLKASLIILIISVLCLEVVNPLNEGIFNIALAAISIYTALLVLGSLGYTYNKEAEEIPISVKLTARTLLIILALYLIYNGFVFMGVLWLFSYAVIYSKKLEETKRINDEKE